MKKLLFMLCFLLVNGLGNAFAQNSSNKGKEFLVPYSAHIDGLTSRLSLFLSADQATTYEVLVGTKVISSGAIPANTALPIIVDPNVTAVYIASSDVVENDKAITVRTVQPISLYAIISNAARTGGTMVLPTNTLGREYYAFTYKNAGTSPSYAQFTIVATADDTEVEITPTDQERNGNHQANATFTKKLNKGQIYQYQSANNGDLTGSRIRSTKGCQPIAVFSGNTWAAFCEPGVARAPSGGDNLYQQLFPLTAWGKNFVTAPFYNTTKGNTDVIKIVVGEDNTIVTVNGSTTNANGIPLGNPYPKGAVITFFSPSANVIKASKAIAVAQYQTSQNCNPANTGNTPSYPGDPEITVLNPVEQTLTNITVYSRLENVPTQINNYYINVIIKTADVPTFRIDGNLVTGFVPIDNEYSYAIINVTNSPLSQHRLAAAGGFSAIAYGYGNVESYAYLAGANIKNFTFQPVNAATKQSITGACVNEAIELSISLPYRALNLTWDLAGNPIIDQAMPTATGTVNRDGVLYYNYQYPKQIVYLQGGDYGFNVKAKKATPDECGGDVEELAVEFTVDPEPSAAFEISADPCETTAIQFKDISKSNSAVRSITKWRWDFGDNQYSDEQNPSHRYQQAGEYAVTLTIQTDAKCEKTSETFKLTVFPKAKVNFNVTANRCVNREVVIENLSTIANGYTIKNYNWDFGDGTIIDRSDAVPPAHQYATSGFKNIKLTLTTDRGCVSAQTKAVDIVALPTADFLLPDACLSDVAIFVNLSKNFDGSQTGLTYVWDFGDANSGALNASPETDGKHRYSAPGDYTVTLKIHNVEGCEVVVLKTPFKVNGANPVASFIPPDVNGVCSNVKFSATNTSTVDFGKVTRLEWYIDGKLYQADEEPEMGKVYDFEVEPFSTPLSKTIQLKLIAFSGSSTGSCRAIAIENITLKASPIVQFDALQPICLNGGLLQFNAVELGGLAGSLSFSGAGVSSTGLFNPVTAGVGSHEINVTFSAENGCSASKTQTITVLPLPKITAGSDFYILVGGEKQLVATATGSGLSYSWSPTSGLSNPNILNPIAKPEKDTNYTLTVTAGNGCTSIDDVYVYVLQDIQIPNSFTPNGDGVNDVWNVKYLDSYPNATVEVYDRSGQRVFVSRGYGNPFDGSYKGQILPVATYYYIINPGNGRKSMTGNLTIFK
jgi:gliding motility-associated-like protein